VTRVKSTIRKAIFLDRDGTIIEDRGDLSDPDSVEFIPGVFEALLSLRKRFAFFIVTNQPGISRGTVTAAQVETVNNRVVDVLAGAGVSIERVYVCPHTRAEGCECIKPKQYFLRLAELEHGIDLEQSYVVGDHPHDVEFAESAGATGIYVLTGHGKKHLNELQSACIILPSLAELPQALACTARPDE
jgi:histidinol-phosphate phosphatase family protein